MSFRRRSSSRRKSIRIDATEELANILLSTKGFRRARYDDIADLIPYADLNSKVVTREDEYTPVGKLSIDWDLPGEKSLFEAFLQYEYIPMMGNLLENKEMRTRVQTLLQMFIANGATIEICHPELTEFINDTQSSLEQTVTALNSLTLLCNRQPIELLR